MYTLEQIEKEFAGKAIRLDSNDTTTFHRPEITGFVMAKIYSNREPFITLAIRTNDGDLYRQNIFEQHLQAIVSIKVIDKRKLDFTFNEAVEYVNTHFKDHCYTIHLFKEYISPIFKRSRDETYLILDD